MNGQRCRSLALLALVVTSAAGGATASGLDCAEERGLEFLAQAWRGDGYDDDYLAYVYPAERLDCPLPGCRLTYRLLDAYINLAFLERAGVLPGPATAQFDRARGVLEALPPRWRHAGLNDLARDTRTDGIALDTYCIVGLIERDRAMADVVARHLDGDRWLADGLYDEVERFREIADESWCIRLLRFASPEARRQRSRLVRSALDRGGTLVSQDRPSEFRVNVALHLLYLLREMDGPAVAVERARWADVLLRAAESPGIVDDLLTQANILEALAAAPEAPPGPQLRLATRLLRHQQPDGGWHSRVGEIGSGLRVFTTLRALLALQAYDQRTAAGRRRGSPDSSGRRILLIP